MSLRERQRLEVSQAIHDAAATLVMELGWAEATIDLIAAKAGVSNRTFFNYFAAKEDAVLGLQPFRVPEEALQEFRSGTGDLLDRTVKLTMSVLQTSTPNDEFRERRSALISSFPELRLRLTKFATSAGDLIQPILVEELTSSSKNYDEQLAEDAENSALALRMLASTVIRHAFTQDPTTMSTASTEILESAVKLFRKVLLHS